MCQCIDVVASIHTRVANVSLCSIIIIHVTLVSNYRCVDIRVECVNASAYPVL